MDISELEARRAKRRQAQEAAKEEQYAKDLAAIDEYEQKHNVELDVALRVPDFMEGLPAVVGVMPRPREYKRFLQLAQSAKNDAKKAEALEQLARVAWAYPEDKETREAMLERMPGLLLQIGSRAVKLCEAELSGEGKD